MKTKLSLVFIVFITMSLYAQVKIGDNPSVIHANSILELESIDKALVISRMSDIQMNAIVPLRGALVFNTDQNCVFLYDGTSWKSLCTTTGGGSATGTGIDVTTSSIAPTINNIGDFWINNTKNNATSIWDGTSWISIDNNPRKGNGIPNSTTAPSPISGDVYVDTSTGNIYAYNGTGWVSANTSANNGLLIDATNTIQLGGILIKPTVIETNITNTLSITGLQNGDVTQDDIVTVNKITGQLRKVTYSSIFREEIAEITAIDSQTLFTPPLTITDAKKVNVYRNGVRVDFTVVNPTTIAIEPEATCYLGDQIRIVQFY